MSRALIIPDAKRSWDPRGWRGEPLRQGIGATLAGIALGIVAGMGLTRTMASLLFGVQPTDVATFAVVSVLLMLVAIAASYIPARRAMQTDPLEALRHE